MKTRQLTNAKVLLWLIFVAIPSIIFLNVKQANVVTVQANYPKEVVAGTSFTIMVTIDKGNLNGFGRYTHTLPRGCVAESNTQNFDFSDNTVKFLWVNIPYASTFTFSYTVHVPADYKGTIPINGKFGYVIENERRFSEIIPNTITVKNDPLALRKYLAEKDLKKAPIQINDISCYRSASITGNEAIINLRVNKSHLNSMCKIEELLPEGFVFHAIERQGAEFSSINNVARFMWIEAPEKEIFTVSYKVIPSPGYSITQLFIHGAFSFIDNGVTQSVTILERDMNAINESTGKPLESSLEAQYSGNVESGLRSPNTLSSQASQKNYSAKANYDINADEIHESLTPAQRNISHTPASQSPALDAKAASVQVEYRAPESYDEIPENLRTKNARLEHAPIVAKEVNIQAIPSSSLYFPEQNNHDDEDPDEISAVQNPSYNKTMESNKSVAESSTTPNIANNSYKTQEFETNLHIPAPTIENSNKEHEKNTLQDAAQPTKKLTQSSLQGVYTQNNETSTELAEKQQENHNSLNIKDKNETSYIQKNANTADNKDNLIHSQDTPQQAYTNTTAAAQNQSVQPATNSQPADVGTKTAAAPQQAHTNNTAAAQTQSLQPATNSQPADVGTKPAAAPQQAYTNTTAAVQNQSVQPATNSQPTNVGTKSATAPQQAYMNTTAAVQDQSVQPATNSQPTNAGIKTTVAPQQAHTNTTAAVQDQSVQPATNSQPTNVETKTATAPQQAYTNTTAAVQNQSVQPATNSQPTNAGIKTATAPQQAHTNNTAAAQNQSVQTATNSQPTNAGTKTATAAPQQAHTNYTATAQNQSIQPAPTPQPTNVGTKPTTAPQQAQTQSVQPAPTSQPTNAGIKTTTPQQAQTNNTATAQNQSVQPATNSQPTNAGTKPTTAPQQAYTNTTAAAQTQSVQPAANSQPTNAGTRTATAPQQAYMNTTATAQTQSVQPATNSQHATVGTKTATAPQQAHTNTTAAVQNQYAANLQQTSVGAKSSSEQTAQHAYSTANFDENYPQTQTELNKTTLSNKNNYTQNTTKFTQLPYNQTQAKIHFSIQVSAGHKKLRNTAQYFKRLKIKESVVIDQIGNWFKYTVHTFETYIQARNKRNEIWKESSVKDAFVVAYNGKKRITVQEALMITNQKWTE